MIGTNTAAKNNFCSSSLFKFYPLWKTTEIADGFLFEQ